MQNSLCVLEVLRCPIGSVSARQSSSGREPNCGVEHRAPPIFGRATITLGIGPHSSGSCHRVNTVLDTAWKKVLSVNKEVRDMDSFCRDLVSHANKTAGLH